MASSRAGSLPQGICERRGSSVGASAREEARSANITQQPIANPRLGHDKPRPRRIIRQFLP